MNRLIYVKVRRNRNFARICWRPIFEKRISIQNISQIENVYDKMKCLSNELQFGELEEAVKSADTPEEINNGPATAPSVRLMKAIAGYNKVVYGACLASEIGLTSIRSKCKLFDEWITLCLLQINTLPIVFYDKLWNNRLGYPVFFGYS